MYETKTLQDMLKEHMVNNAVDAVDLESKDDLSKTGIKPKIFIEYAGSIYKDKEKRNFYPTFNIYVVDKTLSSEKKDNLLSIIDKIRLLFISAQVEYRDEESNQEYVSKSNPIVITGEDSKETKNSMFVYMITLRTYVRI